MCSLREKKKNRTRRKIAEAAAELLATMPEEQVTIAAIAERAEISPRTFHNYFSTRDEAFFYFFEMLIERWEAEIKNAPDDVEPVEVLHRLVDNAIRQQPDDPYSITRIVMVLDYINVVADPVKKQAVLETTRRLGDAMYRRCSCGTSETQVHVLVNLALFSGGLATKMGKLAAASEVVEAAFNILRHGTQSTQKDNNANN